jgi:hypothetical protein
MSAAHSGRATRSARTRRSAATGTRGRCKAAARRDVHGSWHVGFSADRCYTRPRKFCTRRTSRAPTCQHHGSPHPSRAAHASRSRRFDRCARSPRPVGAQRAERELLPHRHRRHRGHLLSDRRPARERDLECAGLASVQRRRLVRRPGLVATAVASNGSVANINGITSGSLESGFTQSDVAYWAYSGTGTVRRQAEGRGHSPDRESLSRIDPPGRAQGRGASRRSPTSRASAYRSTSRAPAR